MVSLHQPRWLLGYSTTIRALRMQLVTQWTTANTRSRKKRPRGQTVAEPPIMADAMEAHWYFARSTWQVQKMDPTNATAGRYARTAAVQSFCCNPGRSCPDDSVVLLPSFPRGPWAAGFISIPSQLYAHLLPLCLHLCTDLDLRSQRFSQPTRRSHSFALLRPRP